MTERDRWTSCEPKAEAKARAGRTLDLAPECLTTTITKEQ